MLGINNNWIRPVKWKGKIVEIKARDRMEYWSTANMLSNWLCYV